MPINLKHERRVDRRYPLAAEVAYRIAGYRGQAKTGYGRSIDVSRSSVFFSTEEPVPVGTLIELSLPWPARLYGTTDLSFVVTGTTFHVRGDCVAVRIHRYDFRTRSSRSNTREISADKKDVERGAPATGVRPGRKEESK